MSKMAGWTVAAGSALAVAALIGGGAYAANTLGDEPAPEPQRQEPAQLVEPVDEPTVTVAEETTTISPAPEPTVTEETASAEPTVESVPAEPEPVATTEEQTVTPKPEPTPEPDPLTSRHPAQGHGPNPPPVAPDGATPDPDDGAHNQAPQGG